MLSPGFPTMTSTPWPLLPFRPTYWPKLGSLMREIVPFKRLSKLYKGLPAHILTNTWVNDHLNRKGKVVVGKDPKLQNKLISMFHDSTVGGALRYDNNIQDYRRFVLLERVTETYQAIHQRMQYLSEEQTWECGQLRTPTTVTHPVCPIHRHQYGFHRRPSKIWREGCYHGHSGSLQRIRALPGPKSSLLCFRSGQTIHEQHL